jgi:hypothetical protein
MSAMAQFVATNRFTSKKSLKVLESPRSGPLHYFPLRPDLDLFFYDRDKRQSRHR